MQKLDADIAVLRQKQDNGADYIMTQLCWDMEQFKYWLDAIREAGVTMPVDVGVMRFWIRQLPLIWPFHVTAV